MPRRNPEVRDPTLSEGESYENPTEIKTEDQKEIAEKLIDKSLEYIKPEMEDEWKELVEKNIPTEIGFMMIKTIIEVMEKLSNTKEENLDSVMEEFDFSGMASGWVKDRIEKFFEKGGE